MKRAPKWKFSSLMDQSVIFTQISPKLSLYTKWAKIKPYLKRAPFKYPKWKFASAIEHFIILRKLTKTFFNFKMSKIKISKMSKIKIHIWEKHPWNLVNGCFWVLNPEDENKKPELSNSGIIYLIKLLSYITRFFYCYFFILKFPSYEKLAMTSQFDLSRFYDVIICNSDF